MKHRVDGTVRAVKMIEMHRASSLKISAEEMMKEGRSMMRLSSPFILRYFDMHWRCSSDGSIQND
jgi:hypothetical protein